MFSHVSSALLFPSDVLTFHAAKHTSILFAIRLVQSDTFVVQLHLQTNGLL